MKSRRSSILGLLQFLTFELYVLERKRKKCKYTSKEEILSG